MPKDPLTFEWFGFGCMWPPMTTTFLPPSIQSPPTLVVDGRLILASWPEASTTLVTPLPYLVSFAGTSTVMGLVRTGGAHASLLVSVGSGRPPSAPKAVVATPNMSARTTARPTTNPVALPLHKITDVARFNISCLLERGPSPQSCCVNHSSYARIGSSSAS